MSNIPSTDELTKKAPFLGYFIDPIKNHYVDFEGTATRTQYWMFVLVSLVIAIVLAIVLVVLTFALGAVSDTLGQIMGIIMAVVFGVYYLGLLLPSLGIAVRRLRDGGFSPWLILLNLIPIGGLIVFILLCLPSKEQASA